VSLHHSHVAPEHDAMIAAQGELQACFDGRIRFAPSPFLVMTDGGPELLARIRQGGQVFGASRRAWPRPKNAMRAARPCHGARLCVWGPYAGRMSADRPLRSPGLHGAAATAGVAGSTGAGHRDRAAIPVPGGNGGAEARAAHHVCDQAALIAKCSILCSIQDRNIPEVPVGLSATVYGDRNPSLSLAQHALCWTKLLPRKDRSCFMQPVSVDVDACRRCEATKA